MVMALRFQMSVHSVYFIKKITPQKNHSTETAQ